MESARPKKIGNAKQNRWVSWKVTMRCVRANQTAGISLQRKDSKQPATKKREG